MFLISYYESTYPSIRVLLLWPLTTIGLAFKFHHIGD
jgi:hypothetical protein